MKLLVIPAAGQAKRLRPLSNNMSKAMVPVAGKPVLAHIIDSAKEKFDAIVVVHGQNPDIENYVSVKYKDLNVLCVRQDEPKGPLHAIHCGLESAHEEYAGEFINQVAVWLGDTLIKFRNSDMDKITWQDCVVAHPVPDWHRWCLVDDKMNFYDKPKARPENFQDLNALVGVYSFTDFYTVREITEDIINSGARIGGEFQISQLLDEYKKLQLMHVLKIDRGWYDFGDLPSLYKSSADLISESGLTRPDGKIKVDHFAGAITKSGDRCANEIRWYKYTMNNFSTCASAILQHIPQVYSLNPSKKEYTMEFVAGSPVSDFLLYEQISDDAIEFILRKVVQVYAKTFYATSEETQYNAKKSPVEHMFLEATFEMWRGKTCDRLLAYEYDWIEPVDLMKMLKYVSKYGLEAVDTARPSIIHGDYHLGNIIFDPATAKMKAIDPRGDWGGYNDPTIGDMQYDIAKLLQSIYGEYVWIYAEMETDERLKELALRCIESELIASGIVTPNHLEKIKKYVPILLATCIPFHDDSENRQKMIWGKAMEMINE